MLICGFNYTADTYLRLHTPTYADVHCFTRMFPLGCLCECCVCMLAYSYLSACLYMEIYIFIANARMFVWLVCGGVVRLFMKIKEKVPLN